jgi:hypothetical protein
MTAADDWTKELETKGWPDLKNLYTKLGKPDNVMATFNIHWKHNYNHVSRTTMYGFMNDHFGLGFKKPVLERDFQALTQQDLTVWTPEHPAPSGDNTGEAHEKKMLGHWAADSDKALAGPEGNDIRRSAWEMMIGRSAPAAEDITADEPAKEQRGDHLRLTGTLRHTPTGEEVKVHYALPKDWNGTAVVWLTDKPGGLDAEGSVAARASEIVASGAALVVPELYLTGTSTAPRLIGKSEDPNAWDHAACYTYGYNPTLLASRVHDAMTVVVSARNNAKWPVKKLILAGSDGAGPVAAAAALLLGDHLNAVAIDTEGFRFEKLTDQYQPMFVPGAVKYGDLPALLALCAPLPLSLAGEEGKPETLSTEAVLGK